MIKNRNTLQIIAFLISCCVLTFVIYQLSDRLSWCDRLTRVMISTFVAAFLFVIPNIEQLRLNIPKGITAVGAIGVFFALIFIPVECENNYYIFNIKTIDRNSKTPIKDVTVEFMGDAIGKAKIFEKYNGTSIEGNFNISEKGEVLIRCSHPKYQVKDTTLLIKVLKNNKTILLEINSLKSSSSIRIPTVDYSKYKFSLSTDTTNSNKNIKELYIDYNSDMFSRFQNRLLNKDISGITLLAAPGGYGKSFVVSDNVILSVVDSIDAIEYEFPKEIIGEFNQKSDLKVDLIGANKTSIILGKLPNLDTFSVELYYTNENLFDQSKKKVILFDGLDEIHPNSAERILKNIKSNYKKYLNTHIILLARPETFNSYYSNPQLVRDENIHFIQLSEIIYKTKGDLNLRVSNICEYLPGVCKDLEFEALVNLCAEILVKNPELNEAFGNLRMSKDFIAFVATMLKSGRSVQSDELKSYIISRIFDDEKKKHNRPSTTDQEVFGFRLYSAMFHEVTKKYSSQVSKDGSFMVLDTDNVSFDFEEKNYSFFVRDLLDRSGLINMNPADTPAKLYRFSPSFAFNYFLRQTNI